MILRTASLLALLAVFSWTSGCRSTAPAPAATTATSPTSAASTPPIYTPSPNRIVGRVLSVDRERGFAFVDLVAEAPPEALSAGAELVARTLDLRETGHLRASPYVRGKTLGARILSGQPSPGDEVVWRVP